MTMRDCPKCKTDSFVEEHHTLLFTLMDWKTIVAFMLVVLTFGHLIQLYPFEVIACAVASAIPLCVKILHKGVCERCEIEFPLTDSVAPNNSIHSSRPQ